MKPFRHIVTALLVLAFVLGVVGNAAMAKSPTLVVGGPCHMMASMHASDSSPSSPCKTIRVDCANQVGCLTVNALPTLEYAHQADMQHTAVNYWSGSFDWANVAFIPDPLPPRTI